jgi:hypothetical protein
VSPVEIVDQFALNVCIEISGHCLIQRLVFSALHLAFTQCVIVYSGFVAIRLNFSYVLSMFRVFFRFKTYSC